MKPETAKEQKLWPDILDRLPRNLRRGFVDHWKIPTRYAAPRRIGKILDRLHYHLKRTAKAPKVRACHLRTYRDWDALVQQTDLSLKSAVPPTATV